MERGMELLRPGAIPSQVFAEVVKAVEKAGVNDYSKLATFCGHGIGIEARDYPIFTKPVKATSPFLPGSYDVPIEEGMVIMLEMPHSVLGLGGFQIEYVDSGNSSVTRRCVPLPGASHRNPCFRRHSPMTPMPLPPRTRAGRLAPMSARW
jgi:Xaa-Pro aminopeptidase